MDAALRKVPQLGASSPFSLVVSVWGGGPPDAADVAEKDRMGCNSLTVLCNIYICICIYILRICNPANARHGGAGALVAQCGPSGPRASTSGHKCSERALPVHFCHGFCHAASPAFYSTGMGRVLWIAFTILHRRTRPGSTPCDSDADPAGMDQTQHYLEQPGMHQQYPRAHV
eukprot:352554-Chlamydomonas_euryale.AAC.3